MKKIPVLRLNFNKQKMYAHRITFDQIKETLEKSTNKFKCVYGSYEDKVMDLVPVIDNIQNNTLNGIATDRQLVEYTFLHNILPIILDLPIKGIPGVRRLIPAKRSLINYCYKSKDKGNNTWKIYLNNRRIKYEGVDIFQIRNMFKMLYTDVRLKNFYSTKRICDFTGSIIIKAEEDPLLKLKKELNLREKDAEFISGTEVWYCEGEGYINSNSVSLLDEEDEEEISAKEKADDVGGKEKKKKTNTEPDIVKLLCHPMIDETRSYTNNIHNINKTLGIEAARNYVIQSLNRIFMSTGVNINTKYFILLADYLTNKGKYHGVLSTKFHKNAEYSFLEQANAGDALGTFTKFAISKTKNEINNDLSSIAVGELSKSQIEDMLNDENYTFTDSDLNNYFNVTSKIGPTFDTKENIIKIGIQEEEGEIKTFNINVPESGYIDTDYYDNLFS